MSGELTAWERTELARHANRPYPLDYIERMFTGFSEIHGDRAFGDDAAMICGMANFRGREVLVLGTQKGRDTKQRLHRNFGQPNPEGYRKALRAMKFAEKWKRPVISLVDVVGAYPGLGAEERGQAEAIAHNLREMARLAVPFIAVITGEGGSGGALAIAVADRVLMLENSIYSVISPEGCASIMWRDSTKKDVAAQALRITAKDNLEMGICDEVIPEPPGGAHSDHDGMAKILGDVLGEASVGAGEDVDAGVAGRALQQVPQHGAVLRSGGSPGVEAVGYRLSAFVESAVNRRCHPERSRGTATRSRRTFYRVERSFDSGSQRARTSAPDDILELLQTRLHSPFFSRQLVTLSSLRCAAVHLSSRLPYNETLTSPSSST